MAAIIYKRQRGIITDLFSMLGLYSKASSLEGLCKSYNMKADTGLCESYSNLYSFIDDNIKELKPFFVKSPNAQDEGSIFHKMTQMLLVSDNLDIKDVIDFFKGMDHKFFLAEVFRLTDGTPGSERQKYIEIVEDKNATDEFLNRQNYTVREKRAIHNFRKGGAVAYESFLQFIKSLYSMIRKEHVRNEEKLTRYMDWVQYRLNESKDDFLFKDCIEYKHIKDSGCDGTIIVTVCLFPPFSAQLACKDDIFIACLGYGAFTNYSCKCVEKQKKRKANDSSIRTDIMNLLQENPMRLSEVAKILDISQARVSYHMRILEEGMFIKRIRFNGREHFALGECEAVNQAVSCCIGGQ